MKSKTPQLGTSWGAGKEVERNFSTLFLPLACVKDWYWQKKRNRVEEMPGGPAGGYGFFDRGVSLELDRIALRQGEVSP